MYEDRAFGRGVQEVFRLAFSAGLAGSASAPQVRIRCAANAPQGVECSLQELYRFARGEGDEIPREAAGGPVEDG